MLVLYMQLKGLISSRGQDSGGSRNSKKGFPLVVDPRHRGLGVQTPAAEQVLILKVMKFY